MNELLRQLLSSNFALYLKTHMFHWNVEGPNFGEYHEFWSGVYTDLHAQTDVLAEFIRQLDEYAPGSLSVYAEESVIKDMDNYPNAEGMFAAFMIDNQIMIKLYDQLFHKAEAAHEHQVSDFAATRLAAHKKLAWMVKSYTKKA